MYLLPELVYHQIHRILRAIRGKDHIALNIDGLLIYDSWSVFMNISNDIIFSRDVR